MTEHIDFKVGDWVVNEHGYVCKLKKIHPMYELVVNVNIADGLGWFGLVFVFLDRSRIATSEEVKAHKESKDSPFKVGMD